MLPISLKKSKERNLTKIEEYMKSYTMPLGFMYMLMNKLKFFELIVNMSFVPFIT